MMASALLLTGLSVGAIVARAKEVDARIEDLQARIQMDVVASGQTKRRVFDLMLRREGVNYRALLRLIEPREMAGTRFLIVAERGKRNRQWAYFPDLGIVRAIKGVDLDDPFLGSDVTYNDLAGGAHLDDLTHRLLGEEMIEAAPCYVLEGTPRHRIGYGKLRGWVRKDNFVTVRALFFDRASRPMKEARLSDVRELDGALLAHRIEVRSLTKPRRTLLQLQNVRLNRGLGPELFTEARLKGRLR